MTGARFLTASLSRHGRQISDPKLEMALSANFYQVQRSLGSGSSASDDSGLPMINLIYFRAFTGT